VSLPAIESQWSTRFLGELPCHRAEVGAGFAWAPGWRGLSGSAHSVSAWMRVSCENQNLGADLLVGRQRT
jgi:hypothetical protein